MSTKKTKNSKSKRKSTRRKKRSNSKTSNSNIKVEDVEVMLSMRKGYDKKSAKKKNRRKNSDQTRALENAALLCSDDDESEPKDVLGIYKQTIGMNTNSSILIPEEEPVRSNSTNANDCVDDDEHTNNGRSEIEVPIPFIVAPSRKQPSASEMKKKKVDDILQASGRKALQHLFTIRHGECARKSTESTAGAENSYSISQQYEQFERGVRSIQDDAVEGSSNDLTRTELIESLQKMPSQDAEKRSVRMLDAVRQVEKRKRPTEEEYMRAPHYEGEQECVMGQNCQGMHICDSGGFVLVEYNSLALVEHRREHSEAVVVEVQGLCKKCQRQFCVICSRKMQQPRWSTSAARNSAYDQNEVPDILPDYHNLIGPGEYDARDVYPCSQNKIQFPVLPVVVFSNTSFRRGSRKMPDGTSVPEYKQTMTKPNHPAFRDGRT
jgi:hypothetical protein